MKDPVGISDAGGVFTWGQCSSRSHHGTSRPRDHAAFGLRQLSPLLLVKRQPTRKQAQRPLLPCMFQPPDFAIELPDLNIAASEKLVSGGQRFRVCRGLDRFVGNNTIVFVYEISPIGRHDVLLPQTTRGKWNSRAWSHAGTEGTERHCDRNETETETLQPQSYYA